MSQAHDMASAAVLSLAEWYELQDEPGELVDGRLVEEEVPSFLHEILVVLMGSIFRDWVVPRGGFVAGSEAKYAVSSQRGRKPDLTVFFADSPRPPARGLIHVPPDIALEVVSPTPRDGRRDRVEKLAEYAAFGVRYYWILDPQLRSLEILELSGSSYRHVLGVSAGTIDVVPGCPGLVLDLDAVWAEIERLED